ncbi:farnesyl-diphosphate synthase [Sinisalibacter lacisalsi]|uniref:Farnesyl-diphosphate synthase n=2 Tax=Sinisalibacter lacisalsi TaxID=1526570 RepID=A0ABQ1QR62_9RHOB|nr:farnesyl-diphosphate synthase [Sinisalibacter lacisalsi]
MLMNTQQTDAAEPLADPVSETRDRAERYLEARLSECAGAPATLHAAMRDAILAGGKRVRPILCMMINKAAGGRNAEFAHAAGAAVEFVHCASLILDDLPSMDDATMRRGRPAVHRIYGEATAILAAIGLMNLAYEQIARAPSHDETIRARAMRVLTEAIGTAGLVAGQELDLREKATAQSAEDLDTINWMKTGVLFVAAAELGAIAAGASQAQLDEVRGFAHHLGLAFQTRDDILDQIATSEETGKDSHKDDGSATLIRLAGFEAASSDCRSHLEKASAALERSGLQQDEIAELICRVFKQVSEQPA